MMRLVTPVSSLTGLTQFQPMDGEAMGRLVLQLVGFLLSAFLFYVVFRDVRRRFS
jgi:hypothetical protein